MDRHRDVVQLSVSALCFVMRNKLGIPTSVCLHDTLKACPPQPWGIHEDTCGPAGGELAVSGCPDLSVLCARAHQADLSSARVFRIHVGLCCQTELSCPTGVQLFLPTVGWVVVRPLPRLSIGRLTAWSACMAHSNAPVQRQGGAGHAV